MSDNNQKKDKVSSTKNKSSRVDPSKERRRKPKENGAATNESNHPNEKGGAYQVVTRNLSLMLVYRRLIFLTFFSFIAAGCSLLSWFLLAGKDVPPQYVPVMEDGRLLPLLPLSKPNLNDGEVGQFALQAVRKMTNYDYLNWQLQISEAQDYFTPKGWNDYYKAFEKTQIINSVVAGKMIVVAKPSGEIAIVNRGLLPNGTYVWRVEVPISVDYNIHNSEANLQSGGLSSSSKVTLYIERVPNTLSAKGVAISRAVFEN